MEWTIESDPAVFTSSMNKSASKAFKWKNFGTSRIRIAQPPLPLARINLLVQIQNGYRLDERSGGKRGRRESLFFASQVITNVCATQAILGVLLNVETFGKEDGGSGEAEGQEREQTIGETHGA